MNPQGQPATEPEGRGFSSTAKSGISHTHNDPSGLSRLLGRTAQQRALRGGGALVTVIAVVFAVRTLQPAPKARPPATTPVSVERVVRQSVPIYRYGFGTVRANNSVVLKSRVDGALQKVLFNEGEEVKEGDVLAQIDPRPYQAALDLALAKKAQDEALLTKAKGDLARFQTLRNNQFASQQNLEAQQAAVAQAEAVLKGDAAQVDNARVQLSYTTIRAPISGRIGLRQVDAGNMIRATDQAGFASISQVHPIAVIFSLSAAELAAITKAGFDSPLPVTAYTSDEKEKLAEGKLLTVDNGVDETTGTIKLKALFDNKENTLWPGQTVSAHILLDTQRDAMTVPARAVQRGPQGMFVYVLQPDSTVAVRQVEASETVGEKLVVVSTTLHEGDLVITDGQSRLEPGARVVLRSDSRGEEGAPKSAAAHE